VIFASDLDHTLVHPVRHLATARSDVSVVEWLDGRPLSYMSTRALSALGELAANHSFIPVTSRSRRQFDRIGPITALCRHGHSICANGATVLSHGAVDQEWAAHIKAKLADVASLQETAGVLAMEFGSPGPEGWLLRSHTCDDVYWYAVCDARRLPHDVIQRASRSLAPLGWLPILHGRKLYALPRYLTKHAALCYVLEKLPVDEPLVCAGDSQLDEGLLQLADLALAPAHTAAALSPRCQPVTAIQGAPTVATEELLATAMRFAAVRAGGSPADDEAVA
jgi:hydroxymethylpyrimidine pyrophosphatase-like HAD family hydrolase